MPVYIICLGDWKIIISTFSGNEGKSQILPLFYKALSIWRGLFLCFLYGGEDRFYKDFDFTSIPIKNEN